MKIVPFSDIHMQWDKIQLPQGDVLVFAGDACGSGRLAQWSLFVEWLKTQAPAYKEVLVSGGNHDRCVQDMGKQYIKDMFAGTNITYLQDEERVIDGVKFYGAPWSPEFCGWAFATRPEKARKIWAQIPDDVDVLITHGPPKGILDLTWEGVHAGCEELALRILDIKPKFHIFGHIHEAYGNQVGVNGTHHYNVSTCNLDYKPLNPVVVLEIEK